MNKVQTGDPIQIKAATWNSFIDAAEYVKNLQSDQRGGSLSNGNYSGVILLKNGESTLFPRFSAMAITDVLIRPDANEPEFTGKCPAFLGRKVTNAYEEYPYAVLLEPVDAGKIGRALFAAKLEVQLSDDGSIWYAFSPTREVTVKDEETGEETATEEKVEVPQTARLYRFRNAAVGQEWSDPLPLIIGPRGLRSTIQIGTVTTGAETTPASITNSGDEHDAVFDFVIPQGVKGDAASVRVGTVSTGTPGSQVSVTNSGDGHNAVFNFSIPQGIQGVPGTESYLYVAYAAQNDGQGFSLTPANSLKYRAEIISRTPIANPTWSDFTNAQWVKYLGDDAATYGDVLVADQNTSVAKVTRIVFENATIRKGVDGEVIVNFNETELSREEFSNYSIINGRTRLSPWTNGGGSPFGNLGRNIVFITALPDAPVFEPYSIFIGEYAK